MLPAFAGWSPYTFTPSLCPEESRPFFVLPAPFLWAASIVREKEEEEEEEGTFEAHFRLRSPRWKGEDVNERELNFSVEPAKEAIPANAAMVLQLLVQ